MTDAETAAEQWVDTSRKKVREAYAQWYQIGQERIKELLTKYRVDHVKIATDQDYVQPLIRLFKSRA